MRINKNKLVGAPRVTHVAYVLDCSSSMNSIKDSVIDMFNEQLSVHREQAKDPETGDIMFSLYHFSDNVSPQIVGENINYLEGDLSSNEYNCQGMTALYDAVDKAITDLSKKATMKNDQAFLVVVLSDGMENCSRNKDPQRLRNKIDELKDSGAWTFQFFGCDGIGNQQATTVGFSTAGFAKTDSGVKTMSNNLSTATTAYYGARKMGAMGFQALVDENGNPLSVDELFKQSTK